jgi:hypothetical protein
MASQEQYQLALLKLQGGGKLSKTELELLVKASKQAGSFGNQVREALKNVKL